MIRKARYDDTEEIFFVINTSRQKAYEGVVPPKKFRDSVLSIEELLTDFNKMTFYCYETKKKITGVIALKIENEIGWVRWLYILPEHQRKGIGTALLLHIEEKAQEKSLTTVRLHALRKVNWIIQFYKTRGYTPLDEVEGPYGLDLLMEKKISFRFPTPQLSTQKPKVL